MVNRTSYPQEIIRRTAYCSYLAALAGSCLWFAAGLITNNVTHILASALLGASCILFRKYGIRRLDFTLFGRSFPYSLLDSLDPTVNYRRLEEILEAGRHTGLFWIERQDLRRELAAIIGKNPGYLHRYRREIADIHPVLAAEGVKYRR